MARTRSSKPLVKDLDNRRLRGPTCLRPLTKERLAAEDPSPTSLPSMTLSPKGKGRRNRHFCFPKCIQTTYILEILPQSDVSIAQDLEPAVRAIESPCGNFVWGHTKIVEVADTSPGISMVIGADRHMVEVEVLQIILVHNNDNHCANIRNETIAMFEPTRWDPRDLTLEQKEVISVDQILTEIRSWKDKVQCCIIIHERVQEHLMMVSKGPAFPNGMGNDKRYPPPWDTEAWGRRVAERKAKELAYKRAPSRKPSRLGIDGEWDDDDDDGYDVPIPHATLANLTSSQSYEATSSYNSTTSEQSQG